MSEVETNSRVLSQENLVSPIKDDPVVLTKKNDSFLIIVLIILLIVALGTVGYLLYQNSRLSQQVLQRQPSKVSEATKSSGMLSPTPTIDPTSNWKTYTSKVLGFTFRYPLDYNTPEESENYLSLISPLSPNKGKNFELEDSELKIEIVTEVARDNSSSTKKCWDDHNTEGKIVGQPEVMINGTSSTILNWEGHGTGQFICIVHNNQRYLINKYPLETTRQTEFYQILSTFKFTD